MWTDPVMVYSHVESSIFFLWLHDLQFHDGEMIASSRCLKNQYNAVEPFTIFVLHKFQGSHK